MIDDSTLLTSDYPVDKVVWMGTAQTTVPGFDYRQINISHGLGFAPLVFAQWSATSDFSIPYDEYSGPRSSSFFLDLDTYIETTSTQVTIYNTNNTSSSKPVYWRLAGFMPSTVNTEVQPTASVADDFVINTDYNYQKLYLSDVTTYSSTANSTVTVNHNLGYRPFVLGWAEITGIGVKSLNPLASIGNTDTLSVNENSIIFTRSPFPYGSTRFHYRIYLDRAQ